MNTLVFGNFSLLSREAIFLAIFMKNMADPLGVNQFNERKIAYGFCNVSILMTFATKRWSK